MEGFFWILIGESLLLDIDRSHKLVVELCQVLDEVGGWKVSGE